VSIKGIMIVNPLQPEADEFNRRLTDSLEYQKALPVWSR
jgi:hypothetical protein